MAKINIIVYHVEVNDIDVYVRFTNKGQQTFDYEIMLETIEGKIEFSSAYYIDADPEDLWKKALSLAKRYAAWAEV